MHCSGATGADPAGQVRYQLESPVPRWDHAHRGISSQGQADRATNQPATPRHVTTCRARRLQRVLGIDINTCGGELKVIASIEEAQVIGKILAHLQKTAPGSAAGPSGHGGAGAADSGTSDLTP